MFGEKLIVRKHGPAGRLGKPSVAGVLKVRYIRKVLHDNPRETPHLERVGHLSVIVSPKSK